jgi:phage terminase large subunit-like protein
MTIEVDFSALLREVAEGPTPDNVGAAFAAALDRRDASRPRPLPLSPPPEAFCPLPPPLPTAEPESMPSPPGQGPEPQPGLSGRFGVPPDDEPVFASQIAEALSRIAPQSGQELARHQIPPQEHDDIESDITGWVMMAGRGAGKTYAGSRWMHGYCSKYPGTRARIIAPSFADAVASCIEGPSGILQASNHQVQWRPSHPGGAQLTWPNGSVCYVIGTPTPREVDRLRALTNITIDWLEEAAANTQIVEVERQARLSRRRKGAKWIATTTPRPIKTIREWKKDPHVAVTTATAHSNTHADPQWLEELERMYRGTRLYRQEVLGEVLEDVEGALWSADDLDRSRIQDLAAFYEMLAATGRTVTRAAVGVDPANSTGTTGIVSVLTTDDRHLYVVRDSSQPGRSAEQWARVAVDDASVHGAVLVPENDSGGDAIRAVLKAADLLDEVTIFPATARGRGGKGARAEPIALLWEREDFRGHLVGNFPLLEDQLCVPDGTLIATERGQVPIEELLLTDRVWTRGGLYPIAWSGQTGVVDRLISLTYVGGSVSMTPCHPVFLPQQNQFVPARDVSTSQNLLVVPEWASTDGLWRGGDIDGAKIDTATTHAVNARSTINSTELSGSTITDQSLSDTSSTTSTRIRQTIDSKISPASRTNNTWQNFIRGLLLFRSRSNSGRLGGDNTQDVISCALAAVRRTTRGVITRRGALSHAVELSTTDVSERSTPNVCVYNVMVDGPYPEYFANGVLVHNCTFVPDAPGQDSPDRLDAMVWACTYLWARASFSDVTSSWPNSAYGQPGAVTMRRPGEVLPWRKSKHKKEIAG